MPTRHAYASGRQRFGELHLPDGGGGGPWPVVVLIHGGFWKARYRRGLMDPLAADLTARGWAAWNLEYRRVGLMGGGGGVPATLDDVAAGIDALADLDAPLDLARVVAVGHSAGGHLALWAAGRSDAAVPLAGAVGQGAVADLERGWALDLGGGAVRRFCGGSPEGVPAAYDAAAPERRLPAGVPLLLVHGADDAAVPAELAERYAAAARAAGDDVTLALREGEGHFEHIDPHSGAWEDVVAWLTR